MSDFRVQLHGVGERNAVVLIASDLIEGHPLPDATSASAFALRFQGIASRSFTGT
jgi:hypothetical protein